MFTTELNETCLFYLSIIMNRKAKQKQWRKDITKFYRPQTENWYKLSRKYSIFSSKRIMRTVIKPLKLYEMKL